MRFTEPPSASKEGLFSCVMSRTTDSPLVRIPDPANLAQLPSRSIGNHVECPEELHANRRRILLALYVFFHASGPR
jgi:hypothetical protein